MKNQFNKRKMKEIQERRNHLEKTCKNLKVTHTEPFDDRIFFYKPIRLLYCKVPKCGSSYWMQLFKALKFKQQIKENLKTFVFTAMKWRSTKLPTKYFENINSFFFKIRKNETRFYIKLFSIWHWYQNLLFVFNTSHQLWTRPTKYVVNF